MVSVVIISEINEFIIKRLAMLINTIVVQAIVLVIIKWHTLISVHQWVYLNSYEIILKHGPFSTWITVLFCEMSPGLQCNAELISQTKRNSSHGKLAMLKSDFSAWLIFHMENYV